MLGTRVARRFAWLILLFVLVKASRRAWDVEDTGILACTKGQSPGRWAIVLTGHDAARNRQQEAVGDRQQPDVQRSLFLSCVQEV